MVLVGMYVIFQLLLALFLLWLYLHNQHFHNPSVHVLVSLVFSQSISFYHILMAQTYKSVRKYFCRPRIFFFDINREKDKTLKKK